MTVITDIVDAILAEVQAELGATYKELPYLENVEQNNFRGNNDRFGVRPLGALQLPGVTKFVTLSQTFEIVLSKGYIESSLDDDNKVVKSLDNRALMLDIYKRLVNNRAGLPLVVLNLTDLALAEPEFIDESNVVIQRATMTILYRFSLI